jgi:hypothetical protein
MQDDAVEAPLGLLNAFARRGPNPRSEDTIARTHAILLRCSPATLNHLASIVNDRVVDGAVIPDTDAVYYIDYAYSTIGREGGFRVIDAMLAVVRLLPPSPPPPPGPVLVTSRAGRCCMQCIIACMSA